MSIKSHLLQGFYKNNVHNFIIILLKQTPLEKRQKIVNFQQSINQICTVSMTITLEDVDIHATRVNSLSLQRVSGVRTMLKDSQPVETVSLSK